MNYKKVLTNKLYWTIAVIVLLIGGYAYFGGGGGPNLDLVTVTRRTITQEVSTTGNVKPVDSVDLAFQIGGQIASANVKVGDIVSAGQTLATLDSTELKAQLDKAKADLISQQAALSKAQVDLNNYYSDIINTINGAYTSANDAIRVKVDALFTDDETNSPQLTFKSIDSQKEINAQAERVTMRDMLNKWLADVNLLGSASSQTDLEASLSEAKTNLDSIYGFLNLLMNITINSTSISASDMSSYKTDINNARSEIDSAVATVNTLFQDIALQKATITSDEANIQSYQASVDNIEAQISKTSLMSPISGTVTRQDAKVGQIAAANSTLISVISSGNYEIDSYIPEVDIAKVRVGDKAQVTLDAYGNNVIFNTVVTSIDPSETMLEGVATYLTKFHFAKPDVRIKPGMTANIDIITASHDNALSIPQRAVQQNVNREYVLLYTPTQDKNASSTKVQDITTGLHGYDGNIEILNGLSEGDQVVIPRLSQ